ncbi:MAG TPA: hypothetical protein VGI18_02100 [Burkholderiales bacterium]|jgi:hypothetical protein
MKKLLIVAASLMVIANVHAEESLEIGVEMTPVVKQEKAKSDSRFDNYAIENSAAGSQ